MKAFGEDVVHLKEIFDEGTPDVDWLKYIGKTGLVLITRDERVRWNPAERKAITRYKVGAFFLGGKNLPRCKIIQQIIRHWRRIKELSDKTPHPFLFRIPPSGTKLSLFNIRRN